MTRLEATVAEEQKEFQSAIAQLRSIVKDQAARLQKVSDEMEARKSTPQVVAER